MLSIGTQMIVVMRTLYWFPIKDQVVLLVSIYNSCRVKIYEEEFFEAHSNYVTWTLSTCYSWVKIAHMIMKYIFLDKMYCIYIRILLKFIPQGPVDDLVRDGSSNCFAPNRWQDITWPTGDSFCWCIHYDMELFCILLALCEGNPPAPVDSLTLAQRANDRELWCFLYCSLEQTVQLPVIHCC